MRSILGESYKINAAPQRETSMLNSEKPGPLGVETSSESESDFDAYLFDPPVKSRFSSANFLKASQIIRSIRNPSKQDCRPNFWSDEERILTYELAVSILKHSTFLKDALEKSNFYIKHPHLQNVNQEEILVVLYDLIERDFNTSQEDCPLPEIITKVQTAVLSSKTKLKAHIAKLRIKHDATSLENLLPSNIRQKHSIDRNPLYIWVNLRKTSIDKVVSTLKSHGLKETFFEDDTLIQENLFCVSQLHPNLIRLHSTKANSLKNMNIFLDGSIVVQDKSACLPVYILAKALYFKEAINHRGSGMEYLNPFPNGVPQETLHCLEDAQRSEEWFQDIMDGHGKQSVKPECVVVTHCGPGRTAAHLATLLAEAVPRYLSKSKDLSTSGRDLAKALRGKFIFRPPLTVIVFGIAKVKHEETSRYIKRTLGVQNIRLYSDDFSNVHPKDPRLKGCAAILVNPPSSGSALKDPAAYICSEGGDEQVLSQYSEFMAVQSATVRDNNGNSIQYSPTQAKYLSHALSIPNVKLILYTTCSNLTCENTEVVKYCLNEAMRKEETRKCQLYASIVMQSQSRQYKEVTFDVVKLNELMYGYNSVEFLQGGFVDLQPSSACSGVFMVLIRRRERQVTMAKTAVKQFVESQIMNENVCSTFEELSGLVSMQTSLTPSTSALPIGITEDDLSGYLIRKLKLDSSEALDKNASDYTFADRSSIIPLFPAQMKKKISKKAIVKRISTPTHSSLQRQKEKYDSCPGSGVQTPRSGIPSPITILSGRSTASKSRIQITSQEKTNTLSHHHHNHHPHQCHTCSHDHGHVCVCARHAKKFPDMIKNL